MRMERSLRAGPRLRLAAGFQGENLNKNQRSLLVEVLQHQAPDLVEMFLSECTPQYNRAILERVLSALADELVATGLDKEYEPTGRGNLIESLIGVFSEEIQRYPPGHDGPRFTPFRPSGSGGERDQTS
jgi:hypothetical protein